MILIRRLTSLLLPSFWKSATAETKLPKAIVQVVFRLKYPKSRGIVWKPINAFKWQVSFKVNGISYWSLFSSEGDWLETTHTIGLLDIPKQVRENYVTTYGSEGALHIYKIQTSLHTIFEIQSSQGVHGLKLLYDENGKMVGKITG